MGIRLHRTEISDRLFLQLRHDFKFLYRHTDTEGRRRKVRDGRRVHDAVDAEEIRKDQKQRQQENDLPGQGKENSFFRCADGSKEV